MSGGQGGRMVVTVSRGNHRTGTAPEAGVIAFGGHGAIFSSHSLPYYPFLIHSYEKRIGNHQEASGPLVALVCGGGHLFEAQPPLLTRRPGKRGCRGGLVLGVLTINLEAGSSVSFHVKELGHVAA